VILPLTESESVKSPNQVTVILMGYRMELYVRSGDKKRIVYKLIRVIDVMTSSKPEEYPYSSALAHLSGKDDGLVRASPLAGV